MNCSRGFTLIELSIVLVIIGLIVGGVLVGRDLIHAAEIRRTVSELEKMNAAVNTFHLKYNCLPGDCANATSFFSGVSNGDGNGQIDGASLDFIGPQFVGTDRARFFDQLATARFINFAPFDDNAEGNSADGIGYPLLPIGKGFMPYFTTAIDLGYDATTWVPLGQHYFLLGITDAQDGGMVDSQRSTLAPDAFAIDAKMDDGKPVTGTVRALEPNIGGQPGFGGALATPAASDSCVSNASGNPYASSNGASYGCSLSIRAAF